MNENGQQRVKGGYRRQEMGRECPVEGKVKEGKGQTGAEGLKFWWVKKKGGNKNKESKENKGGGEDWRGAPLAQLHNAWGVIWCM